MKILKYCSDGGLVTKSCLTLATPWTGACQAPLSMGFSRQDYWCGLPFPSPGDCHNSGIEPRSLALQAESLLTELRGTKIWHRDTKEQMLLENWHQQTCSTHGSHNLWLEEKKKWLSSKWTKAKCNKMRSVILINIYQIHDPKIKMHFKSPWNSYEIWPCIRPHVKFIKF